jgi:hypothetical protein
MNALFPGSDNEDATNYTIRAARGQPPPPRHEKGDICLFLSKKTDVPFFVTRKDCVAITFS